MNKAVPPDGDDEVSNDEDRTIRERLGRLEEDKKAAKPWPEVKARCISAPEFWDEG